MRETSIKGMVYQTCSTVNRCSVGLLEVGESFVLPDRTNVVRPNSERFTVLQNAGPDESGQVKIKIEGATSVRWLQVDQLVYLPRTRYEASLTEEMLQNIAQTRQPVCRALPRPIAMNG